MKHLFLLGVGPLPFYQTEQLYGFGIRTWQFAKPLLAAGHRITLITSEFGITKDNAIQLDYQYDPAVHGDIEHIPIPQPNQKNQNVLLTRIEDLVRQQKPDAIIAAGSTISTNLAASIQVPQPLWLDLFGDLFAEVQAKSPFVDFTHEQEFFHRTLSRVLLRGDRFSVVSEIQRGAAVGQLGFMGRLNRHTLGEELVWTIPCAMDGEISPVKRRNILRGTRVSSSDFLILCSGGFNTWADVNTLFHGIEGAMEKNLRIHCVVTGGAISGHHEEGYHRFRSLISKSSYESRFHLLGWLPNEDVAQATLECNLGMNVDLPIYESLLGSRNRMLFWMQCGLPILTTVTTEVSKVLSSNELAYGVPTNQPRQITQKILDAAGNPNRLKKMAVKAKRFAYDYFSFDETARPLMDWAENPVKASDNIERKANNGQALNTVDLLWHEWAFPNTEHKTDPSIPRPHIPIIHTRPQGKSWWKRLWGS